MKKLLTLFPVVYYRHWLFTILIYWVGTGIASAQTTITQWTFENSFTLATPEPTTGTGSASTVGSMTGGASAVGSTTGCVQVTGTGAWQIATANPGSTNESSGVQYLASTVGYENIIITYDHRFSNTSTRTSRIQYTLNGTTWQNLDLTVSNYTSNCANRGGIDNFRIDVGDPVGTNVSDGWGRRTIDFSALAGADNNANFGIRIVAAHYAATGQFRQANNVGNVATGGTWRFDNVTVSGTSVSGNTPPTITENTASPFVNLNATGSGSVSGVINNPTDPAATLGIDFTIGDAETAVGSLMVSTFSSNTLVVPNNVANLVLTGAGAIRNLKIVPAGIGLAMITVTVTDGGGTSATYMIDYAASASALTDSRFHTITSDASTAIAVDADYMLVADDEDQTIRLYDRNESGLPLASFDFTSSLGLTDLSGGVPREVDIEGSTRVGNRIYWIASHGNASSGNLRPNRRRIFATDISGSGAATTLIYAGRYDGLRDDLLAWDAGNVHGLGANFFGLTASANVGKIPEEPDGSGFNIEGLVFAPSSTTTAYVAFRAPIVPASARTKALIVPVTNFDQLVTANPTAGPATFGTPIQLDLGGLGIRSIEKNAANEYLIIAGPASGTGDFKFYTWTGNAADAPIERAGDLSFVYSESAFESIVEVPNPLIATSSIQVLMDNGDRLWYNNIIISKDLVPTNHQKFRSDVVLLGAAIIPTVEVTATDASASETGPDAGTFRITRTGATTSMLTLTYTLSGTAASGDYNPTLTGTAMFNNGDAFVDITITPVDDATVEGSETLILTLVDGANYDLGANANATVNITDNDAAPNACPASGIVYVNDDASGANDGSNWTNAYNDLQDALTLACGCTGTKPAIWVAVGTYYPDEGTTQTNNDRNSTFQLCNGVAVYGGFPNTGNPTFANRNVFANVTILSGDLTGDDVAVFTNNSENARHVVTGSGTNNTAHIDGFTVRGGNADGSGSFNDVGGGMFNNAGSPIVANCTFSGNSGRNSGGGMYNFRSSPIVINCIFSGNLINTGGGMFNAESSSPSITNCTFAGNSARLEGGGMFNARSSPNITNCTFSGNSAANNTNGGGGIYNAFSSSSPVITNTVIWNNRAGGSTTAANASIFNNGSTPTITFSLIQNLTPAGTGNKDGITNAANSNYPAFVTPIDPTTAPTTLGNLRLQSTSPAINMGSNAALPMDVADLDNDANITEPLPLDLDLNPRIFNDAQDIVDMGAYEGGCVTPAGTISISATTICVGDQVQLTFTATAGTAPFAIIVNGLSYNVTMSGDVFITVMPTNNTTYTLTQITDNNGCVATGLSQQVSVVLNIVSGVNIVADQVICAGEDPAPLISAPPPPSFKGGDSDVEKSAAPPDGITYRWESSTTNCTTNFAPIPGETGENYDPPVLTITTYYRRAKIRTLNGVTCERTSNCVTITVNPKPDITASATQTTICNGETTTLNFTPTNGLTVVGWFLDDVAATGCNPTGANLSTGTTFNVNPTTTTTYAVIVQNTDGCRDTACLTITVNPKPAITASATQTTICNGETTTLNFTPTANLTVIGWFLDDAAAGCNPMGSSLSTGTTFNVNPTTTTTYAVIVQNTDGCRDTACVTITVNPKPDITASATQTTICNGETTTLNFTPTAGLTVVGWFLDDVTAGCNPTGASLSTETTFNVNPTTTTTYAVIVQNSDGCRDTACVTITVNPKPDISAGATSTAICVGETTTLNFTPTAGLTVIGWFLDDADNGCNPTGSSLNTETTFNANPTTTTTYAVVVQNSDGCRDTACVTITVNPLPTITLGANPIVCAGETTANLSFTATTNSPNQYSMRIKG